jgi:hypothetical protein
MAQQTPVLKNQAYTFTLGLPSVANSGKFASGPTLAAGDVQISKDGGALVNLASLPTSTGKVVVVALSATEMNADNVTIVFSDQAGDEWQDVVVNIQTVVDRFSTHSAADVVTAMQVVASDFQADVSSLATASSIAALNDLSSADVTAAIPSEIDANIIKVNNVTIEGAGTEADPFGP